MCGVVKRGAQTLQSVYAAIKRGIEVATAVQHSTARVHTAEIQVGGQGQNWYHATRSLSVGIWFVP